MEQKRLHPENSDPEEYWLQNVYKKGAKQLTARAAISGMLLGGLMCLSNLYVFFKTGWSMGVTVTASILAYAIFQVLRAIRLSRSPFTILENNAMCSVSSAAGYMTGGGNMAAFGALLMLTSIRPDPTWMIFWLCTIAALGVFVAIPVKRQLINREQLSFPTGTATAETILSLHSAGQQEKTNGSFNTGTRKAKVLAWAGLAGGIVSWMRDARAPWMPFNIPDSLSLPLTLAGLPLKTWTLAFKVELIQIGAGALMSFRTTWSMLIGGIITYAIIAPQLISSGAISAVSYKAIVQWTVWPAAGMLVAAGLTSFILDGRSILRTFSGMTRIFSKTKRQNEPIDEVECPSWWFPAGLLLLGPVIMFLAWKMFDIPLWAGFIALPIAVIMGFVAARVTGETDITPTKALGPVTQAVYGVLTPGNVAGNIMSANVTAGIGLHAADLLTDLKSGYMLGANPRQQFIAQMFGVVAGALVVVPAFWLIIPDPAMIGTQDWPAPAVLVWAGVSEAFSKGLDTLSSGARIAIVVASLLGVVLALAEKYAPKKSKAWVPSPLGLGMSLVLPASNSVSIFIGGLIAEILFRRKPKVAEYINIPAASGFIAGESLIGVVIAIFIMLGVLSR